MGFIFSRSNSITLRSSPPEASSLPSGLMATLLTWRSPCNLRGAYFRLTCGKIPKDQRIICTAGGKHLVIRRPGQVQNALAVPAQPADNRPVFRVPDGENPAPRGRASSRPATRQRSGSGKIPWGRLRITCLDARSQMVICVPTAAASLSPSGLKLRDWTVLTTPSSLSVFLVAMSVRKMAASSLPEASSLPSGLKVNAFTLFWC